MMTIESLTTQLEGVLRAYAAARDGVLGDNRYTQTFKTEQIQTQYAAARAEAEALTTQLWGAAQKTEAGQWELAPDGAIWRESERLENALTAARTAAARSGIAPQEAPYYLARLSSIIAMCTNDIELLAAYEDATGPEKLAWQDLGGSLLPEAYSLEGNLMWNRVRARLERDRRARMDTAQVRAAQDALDNFLLVTVKRAYAATQQVVNEFGRESAYLGVVMRGIEYRRHQGILVLERIPWGWVSGTIARLDYASRFTAPRRQKKSETFAPPPDIRVKKPLEEGEEPGT